MEFNRRKLIAGSLALPVASLAGRVLAQDRPCAPAGFSIDGGAVAGAAACTPSSSTGLLSTGDIRYLGSYTVETDGNDSSYYQGMQVRRVGNEVRLLIAHLRGTLVEVAISGAAYGSKLGTITNQWDIGPYMDWYHKNMWWDESGQRLWTLNADGYTTVANPCRLYTMSLGANGAVSNVRGPIGLDQVSSKRTRSGVLKVPASFQSATGVGPYAIGLGGYTSLMAAGGSCAMGLSLYAIPDPSAVASTAIIGSTAYRALAARDTSPRGKRIWYGYDFTSNTGKGPINYFDGGGYQDNQRPSQPPKSTGEFLSPGSDGKAHWLWGDKYIGGGWLDGTGKRGIVLVGDFGTGKGWYQNSTLNWDGRCCEAHIFDPDHLAQVVSGQRSPSSIEPVAMLALPEMDSGSDHSYGRGCFASYDAVGKRLYVLKCAMDGPYAAKVYVYSVA